MHSIIVLHRLIGETLLFAAAAGLAVSLAATDSRRPWQRAAAALMKLYGILIGIQWLLGWIGYFGSPSEARPSLYHPIIMTVLLGFYHARQARLGRVEFNRSQAAMLFGLAGVLVAAGWAAVYL